MKITKIDMSKVEKGVNPFTKAKWVEATKDEEKKIHNIINKHL